MLRISWSYYSFDEKTGDILVCSRCYNEILWMGWLIKKQKFIFQDFGAWEVLAQGTKWTMWFKMRSLSCTVSTWPNLTSGAQVSSASGQLNLWDSSPSQDSGNQGKGQLCLMSLLTYMLSHHGGMKDFLSVPNSLRKGKWESLPLEIS